MVTRKSITMGRWYSCKHYVILYINVLRTVISYNPITKQINVFNYYTHIGITTRTGYTKLKLLYYIIQGTYILIFSPTVGSY